MTICIAAIGQSGQVAVVASDRMVTASPPPIEFEHHAPKVTEVSRTCVVLTAGDALADVELCSQAIAAAQTFQALSVQQVAQEIQQAYTRQRSERIEALFLRPRGWTLKSFYEEHVRGVPGEIAFGVDRQIATYEHNLSVIIAGIDSGAHIYSIANPGVLDCWDGIGCYAIGSGASHAISTFFLGNWEPTISLSALVFMVYEAKRRAEVAPGVGKETDIAYIDVNGIAHVDGATMTKLDDLFRTKNMPASKGFNKSVEALFPQGGNNHDPEGEGVE